MFKENQRIIADRKKLTAFHTKVCTLSIQSGGWIVPKQCYYSSKLQTRDRDLPYLLLLYTLTSQTCDFIIPVLCSYSPNLQTRDLDLLYLLLLCTLYIQSCDRIIPVLCLIRLIYRLGIQIYYISCYCFHFLVNHMIALFLC